MLLPHQDLESADKISDNKWRLNWYSTGVQEADDRTGRNKMYQNVKLAQIYLTLEAF